MRNYYSFLLLLLLNISYAEDTTHLGRLFFNESERREISKRHKQALVNPQQILETIEQPVVPTNITLNGLIIRSKGKNTVWIDEEKNPHEGGLFGLKINIENLPLDQIEVPVFIHSGEIQAYLKPGQTMNTTNGFVTETYVDATAAANGS